MTKPWTQLLPKLTVLKRAYVEWTFHTPKGKDKVLVCALYYVQSLNKASRGGTSLDWVSMDEEKLVWDLKERRCHEEAIIVWSVFWVVCGEVLSRIV